MIDVCIYEGPDFMGFAYVLDHASVVRSFPDSDFSNAALFCDLLKVKGLNSFIKRRD